jgi:hypothetical protein
VPENLGASKVKRLFITLGLFAMATPASAAFVQQQRPVYQPPRQTYVAPRPVYQAPRQVYRAPVQRQVAPSRPVSRPTAQHRPTQQRTVSKPQTKYISGTIKKPTPQKTTQRPTTKPQAKAGGPMRIHVPPNYQPPKGGNPATPNKFTQALGRPDKPQRMPGGSLDRRICVDANGRDNGQCPKPERQMITLPPGGGAVHPSYSPSGGALLIRGPGFAPNAGKAGGYTGGGTTYTDGWTTSPSGGFYQPVTKPKIATVPYSDTAVKNGQWVSNTCQPGDAPGTKCYRPSGSWDCNNGKYSRDGYCAGDGDNVCRDRFGTRKDCRTGNMLEPPVEYRGPGQGQPYKQPAGGGTDGDWKPWGSGPGYTEPRESQTCANPPCGRR